MITAEPFGDRITDLSVNLEVTGLDPADSSGGTGSVSLGTSDVEDFHMWSGAALVVQDDANTLAGSISNASISNEATASVSAELPLYLTNVNRTILPFSTSLSGALTYLGNLVGLTFTLSGSDPDVIIPGYEGNLWVYLKHLMSKYSLEVVPSTDGSSNVVFRPARSAGTLNDYVVSTSRGLSDQNLAKYIEVHYYNHNPVASGQVYPLPGVDNVLDQTVFQVSAGETLETDIQISAWLSSVEQPEVIDYVNSSTDWSGSAGRYAVAGGDGIGITAAAWTGEGGRLTLELTDDPSVLRLRIVGPRVTAWSEAVGPFAIAATSGNLYSSLRITGTGVTFNQKTVRLATGAAGPLVSEEVGATVDNPLISTLGDAYDLGVRTAQAYASASYALDREYAATGKVFTDYPGARLDGDRAKFRVRSARITPGKVSVSAELDTTYADFNTVYTGKTYADFNTANTGMTYGQWASVPLNV